MIQFKKQPTIEWVWTTSAPTLLTNNKKCKWDCDDLIPYGLRSVCLCDVRCWSDLVVFLLQVPIHGSICHTLVHSRHVKTHNTILPMTSSPMNGLQYVRQGNDPSDPFHTGTGIQQETGRCPSMTDHSPPGVDPCQLSNPYRIVGT